MATPTQRAQTSTSPPSSASSSTSRSAVRRQGSSRRQLRASGGHRQASSMALMQQKLAEMGSYAKYYKAITQNPFQVKIRCSCGRSRNMAWMFLCTWCATGTKVEKDNKDKDKDNTSIVSKLQREEEEEKKKKDDDDEQEQEQEEEKKEEDNNVTKQIQRAFLSCDLCAQKMTESYYCPHCLAAYPAHYVKLHTRCTRCVSCPVCTSPLEKIVYSGSTSTASSASSSAASSSATATTKKKDVYLYQCPFCFWSSNIVGLEASESEALLENLKEKLKRPVEEKTLIMTEIKNKYLNINEELRKEEDRIEKTKRFHTYKGGRSLFTSNTNKTDKDNKHSHKKTKSIKQIKLNIPSASGHGGIHGLHGRQPSMQSVETLNKLEAMKKKLNKKYLDNHVLNNKHCTNIEPPLDSRYVSQFHLRNVSPLQHRLNDPLNQSVEMDKFIPQRFHLMTKESYKCPIKTCGKYVCKPTLRGRQANYDKRTAVLDYLPRINIKLKSGNLQTMNKSEIIIMVQNRHLHEASFKFDATINENDLYSTAKISCSNDWYSIDPADIHIKGGKQKNIKKNNGDYIKGKEAGIIFSIIPKHYSTGPRNVKFSVRCLFKTKLQLKDDKNDKNDKNDKKTVTDKKEKDNKNKNNNNNPFIETELPYILDFDLGPPKTPSIDEPTSTSTPSTTTSLPSINESNDKDQTEKAEPPKPEKPEKPQSSSQHRSRNENEDQ